MTTTNRSGAAPSGSAPARRWSGRRWAVVLGTLVLVLFVLPGQLWPNTKDCADFPNQRAAQAELRRDAYDPHHLDGDADGIACEELRGPEDRVSAAWYETLALVRVPAEILVRVAMPAFAAGTWVAARTTTALGFMSGLLVASWTFGLLYALVTWLWNRSFESNPPALRWAVTWRDVRLVALAVGLMAFTLLGLGIVFSMPTWWAGLLAFGAFYAGTAVLWRWLDPPTVVKRSAP